MALYNKRGCEVLEMSWKKGWKDSVLKSISYFCQESVPVKFSNATDLSSPLTPMKQILCKIWRKVFWGLRICGSERGEEHLILRPTFLLVDSTKRSIGWHSGTNIRDIVMSFLDGVALNWSWKSFNFTEPFTPKVQFFWAQVFIALQAIKVEQRWGHLMICKDTKSQISWNSSVLNTVINKSPSPSEMKDALDNSRRGISWEVLGHQYLHNNESSLSKTTRHRQTKNQISFQAQAYDLLPILSTSLASSAVVPWSSWRDRIFRPFRKRLKDLTKETKFVRKWCHTYIPYQQTLNSP